MACPWQSIFVHFVVFLIGIQHTIFSGFFLNPFVSIGAETEHKATPQCTLSKFVCYPCFWNSGMRRILLQKLSNKAWLSTIIVSGCWPILITIFTLHGTGSLFFWLLEQHLGQECSYGEIAQICGFTQYIYKTRSKFNPPPAMSKPTATYKTAADCDPTWIFPNSYRLTWKFKFANEISNKFSKI